MTATMSMGEEEEEETLQPLQPQEGQAKGDKKGSDLLLVGLVKDKTVSVTGHMKDATVGASQWVASHTTKTAKAALDQARSGLSVGEKFTLFAFEKISILSRKGFTHVFMFLILGGYTALGALLFMAIEAPHETEEKADIASAKVNFLKSLWQEHLSQPANFSDWETAVVTHLNEYEKQLHHSFSVGVSSDTENWTFWKAMFFCSTITTTIGYGHIAPSTSAGRALTIVYAILGIPIFLILMADFGKLFTRLLKALFVFVKKMYRTATCRRVRKTRAVQTVKITRTSPTPTTPPTPMPPLAVPESISSDFDKGNQQEENGGGGEGEAHLRQRSHSLPRRTHEVEVDFDDKDRQECCSSAWVRRVRGWCTFSCWRKTAEDEDDAEGPTPTEDDTIDDNFNLPISLALLILLLYILIGCVIYTMWESWSYFEAFYFIFVSMTTIGFGDYVPKHPAFMMMTTVYLVFGLALTAMCINIIQEKLTDTFRQASEKLKESFGTIMAMATQGEEGSVQEGKEVEIAEVHGGKKPGVDGKSEDGAANADTLTHKKET